MYDFEVKVKAKQIYELTYEDEVTEYDQRDSGSYKRKVTKSERFTDWGSLKMFAFNIDNRKIKQVVEIKDMTDALINDLRVQTKD